MLSQLDSPQGTQASQHGSSMCTGQGSLGSVLLPQHPQILPWRLSSALKDSSCSLTSTDWPFLCSEFFSLPCQSEGATSVCLRLAAQAAHAGTVVDLFMLYLYVYFSSKYIYAKCVIC
ncbi:unnamed protein product [Pipistrellus nathusii]|uniref:Uncharacterized protein n=1 Tax=Pipistrellus nathusii TaxID=59473 RepID=A0ABP0A9M7_PIPNA